MKQKIDTRLNGDSEYLELLHRLNYAKDFAPHKVPYYNERIKAKIKEYIK